MNQSDELSRLLESLRPKLHRYCARMTGSVIDGEDAVQEAMQKAAESFPGLASLSNAEGWIFRIAHNVALDLLRQRARRRTTPLDESVDMAVDSSTEQPDPDLAATSLRTFMRLPPAQRSGVILMDVLGYSLAEIEKITGATVPAVKAALHRGRTRLRELSQEPDDAPAPALDEEERALLETYVARFNARDFDAVRDMLSAEVRLELVAKTRMNGKAEVGRYLHNYSGSTDWHFALGFVEGRPAAIAYAPAAERPQPSYFVLLQWHEGKLRHIRDFRYARYVLDGATVVVTA